MLKYMRSISVGEDQTPTELIGVSAAHESQHRTTFCFSRQESSDTHEQRLRVNIILWC